MNLKNIFKRDKSSISISNTRNISAQSGNELLNGGFAGFSSGSKYYNGLASYGYSHFINNRGRENKR